MDHGGGPRLRAGRHLIIPIGHWVLAEACAQLGRWQESDPTSTHLQIAVNLSARQFTDPDLVSIVADALARAGISPSRWRSPRAC